MARRLDASAWVAAILHDLSSLRAQLGDFDAALAAGEEGLAIRRELGKPWGVAHALDALAELELRRGDSARARDLYQESAEASRAGGREDGAVYAQISVADATRRMGDLTVAAKLFGDNLRLIADWDDSVLKADTVEGVAALLVQHAARLAGGTDREPDAEGVTGVTLLAALTISDARLGWGSTTRKITRPRWPSPEACPA